MFRTFKRLTTLGVAAGALILGASGPAHATLTLTFNDGAGDTANVSSADIGGVTYTTVKIGGYTISYDSTGVNDTIGTGGTLAELNTSYRVKRAAGSGTNTLKISASDNIFSPPTAPPVKVISTASATFTGATSSGAQVLFDTYAAQGSTLFTTTGATTTHPDTVTLTKLSSSGTASDPNFMATDPFTLTSVSTFKLAIGDQVTSFGGESMVPVPEPTTLAAALSGLPLLGIAALRLARRKAC